MDSNEKLLFLHNFPTFLELKTILVRKRREVIPSDPKVMTDIDLSLPVFLLNDGESVVKGDEVETRKTEIRQMLRDDNEKLLIMCFDLNNYKSAQKGKQINLFIKLNVILLKS